MYHTSDFNFELPFELIASHPLEKRDASRMLVVEPDKFPPHNQGEPVQPVGGITDAHIRDFISYLRPGDVVVFNNTRVIPARFKVTRTYPPCADFPQGIVSKFEITLHTSVTDKNWWGVCKKFNKLHVNDILDMENGIEIRVLKVRRDSGVLLHFYCDNIIEVLQQYGKIPLPPYMRREPEEEDVERYQTVYAESLGSVAAPTAGLHFTPELMQEIEDAGAKIVKITLHIGAGTWLPVKTENLDEHKMHKEWCCITTEQARTINNAKRVIAVGTTSMRTLESAHKLVLRHVSEGQIPLLRTGAHRQGWFYDAANPDENVKLPFNPELKERAAEMRKDKSLPAELLWKRIRKKQINGLEFDRHRIIGDYIVDFFCKELGLVIDIDDKTDDGTVGYDAEREKYLRGLGLEIIHINPKDLVKKPGRIASWLINSQLGDPLNTGGRLASLQEKIEYPRVLPFCRTTNIFITPGYKFGAVDVLLTNFHLPKSTLFMLVSAFTGLEDMKAAYKHAIDEKYRFFSYGDCCLLFKNEEFINWAYDIAEKERAEREAEELAKAEAEAAEQEAVKGEIAETENTEVKAQENEDAAVENTETDDKEIKTKKTTKTKKDV